MKQSRERSPHEPLSVLIAALGGQGGGVLTGWIVHAASAEGHVVQATSTPGVSQRTGATTYYVEIAQASRAGAATPVLGLAAIPGRVDVLVCAELLEVARMLERGMCTPDRTLVVASTHRAYTTREKMNGRDGRYDAGRIVEAVRALSRRTVMFDMEAVRSARGAVISAVLFGALAGAGALPLSRAACEEAIRATGIGVESSLAAFDEAFARAISSDASVVDLQSGEAVAEPSLASSLAARVNALPASVARIARLGVAQLLDYQDERYARRYLDRVERIVRAATARPHAMEAAREVARYLALWMAYDDMIRVADAKSRRARLDRIRREANAHADDIVRVRDFLHPGLAEVAAILPRALGRRLEQAAAASSRRPAGRSLTLHTSSITGALAMRLIAALRPLRPYSLRHAREQAAIEEWLALVERALRDADERSHVAADLAQLPRLLGGYGETLAAGRESLKQHIAALGARPLTAAAVADRVRALARESSRSPCAVSRAPSPTPTGQPIVWLTERRSRSTGEDRG